MDEKYVFLNFSLILGLLTLIFSAVFLKGIVDTLSLIALFLALLLAYFFFYKCSFFQKALFVLSICSLLVFMSLFNGVFFDSYSVFIFVINWFFIGLISKVSSNINKITAKNQTFSIIFILYLILNFIIMFSSSGNERYYSYAYGYYPPLEMYFPFVPLIISLILSIVFVITTLNKNAIIDS